MEYTIKEISVEDFYQNRLSGSIINILSLDTQGLQEDVTAPVDINELKISTIDYMNTDGRILIMMDGERPIVSISGIFSIRPSRIYGMYTYFTIKEYESKITSHDVEVAIGKLFGIENLVLSRVDRSELVYGAK